jgi:hypothetical protein
VNRDVKTASALIALARSRRVQRALAHAYLHRGDPMPTLRTSLGYMTTTACVAERVDDRGGHRMSLLGVARVEGVAYVLEELGGGEAPVVYRMWLGGPRAGHLVPLHGWYERDASESEIRRRIAALAPTLEPGHAATKEAWMLSTRIVQRRALRMGSENEACSSELPIRKYALQLLVEPVSGAGPSGKTTVTAFLRPHARLAEVWALPTGGAIARVTFTGIPYGTGGSKDTVVKLTSGLEEM